MIQLLFLIAAMSVMGLAQTPPVPAPDAEQEDLRRAVTEGSSSTVDLLRALEGHLQRFPNSARRPEIERAITKAAIEVKDEKRIAEYGRRVLARDSTDLPTLDRVTRALIAAGDPESMKLALKFGKQYEDQLKVYAGQPLGSGSEIAKRKEDVERALGRALLSQAIATGNLGDAAGAVVLARRSYETSPSPDAALELARRLQQTGKNDDAIRSYADAFVAADASVTDAEKAVIRRRMGELYQKQKGSEAGLGDILLAAYDRYAALSADRKLALKAFDPNSGLSNPLEFTLTSVTGEKLPLSSLLGKAVVLDFWATWCGPCRAQHPLYEEVKKHYAGRNDVVFLAIATDEDRAVVKPFLDEQGWNAQRVYFEDGLSRNLRVTSIPTTVVFGRKGTVVSRMNGFDPPRFVSMLSERIEDALKQ